MQKISCLAAAVAITFSLGAGSALAEEAQAEAKVKVTHQASSAEVLAEKPKKDRVICKKHRPIGTRVATRSCMTEEEWARAQDAGQNAAEGVQRQTRMNDVTQGTG